MKMLKFLVAGLLSLLLVQALAQQQSGSLKGTVTDAQSGEAIVFVNVILRDTLSNLVTGVTTDFDGKYLIKTIPPGYYTVEASFVGYNKLSTNSIQISAGTTHIQNFKLQPASELLQEVMIEYERPLINPSKSSMVTTQESLPFSSVNEPPPAIKRSRGDGTLYFIDGVKVRGSVFYQDEGREEYDVFKENHFLDAKSVPLSTFSSDVDVASYANIRRFISDGQLPPVDAVRIEEMINYFNYDYPPPAANESFSIITELTACSWAPAHQLLKIAIATEEIPLEKSPANNLVFLLDVSGSMQSPDKLPLLKRSLNLLVNQLRDEDRVAIVVYAGSSGLVLPSTSGNHKEVILQAVDRLRAGGSTAGAAGIKLAYQVAEENFRKGANNRVILATDGDFNVGLSDDQQLQKLIEEKRESGVFLSVLGFGSGNLKDRKMEMLADHGNGNYSYIDNLFEAQKVLVKEMGSTLHVVAKDTKFQVEFNPAIVQAYRLIGYENRIMPDEDFNDDTKDAGDVGAGHSVTVLYEIIPTGQEVDQVVGKVDPLKYQIVSSANDSNSDELATVKLRHKKAGAKKSSLSTHTVFSGVQVASSDFRFVQAVAQFGLILRESEYKGNSSYEGILALARAGKGEDEDGYRSEFIRLVSMARDLADENSAHR